jgi:hypothetical protein
MKLCVVKSNLDQVHQREFDEYSKRCWQKGKHHFMVRFTVKVIISPADLKFEVCILSQFQYHIAHSNVLSCSCGLRVRNAQGTTILSRLNGMLLALL